MYKAGSLQPLEVCRVTSVPVSADLFLHRASLIDPFRLPHFRAPMSGDTKTACLPVMAGSDGRVVTGGHVTKGWARLVALLRTVSPGSGCEEGLCVLRSPDRGALG